MPHKVVYKSITSGKGILSQVSKRKDVPAPGASSLAPKKLKNASKVLVSEAAPAVSEAVVEAFGPPSPPTRDPITIVIPDRVSPSLGEVPPSSSHSPPVFCPLESTSGSGGPLLPTPYALPSGMTVTKDTVSKLKAFTTSLILKNRMLRKDLEGILECSSPDELHDTFSHFQRRAMECAYGLFLKWKEAETARANLNTEKSLLEERLNGALARANDFENKYRDLQNPTRFFPTALADIEKRLEELSLRPSPEAVTETFKKSNAYNDLLIDNTVSIMKEFSSEVYLEFRGIHSLFPEFVEITFGKEYVVHLTDSDNDEDTESDGSGEDEAFIEDAPAT
ncbi:hypothetical protein LIER_04368 [Lithospermum erythrorhizon]|uniref:Uncharacterized protein n=1 Tax=Lithospermum erythrorhizon TaxID=34254 RepID=A0AAV3NWN2_LITER